MSDLLSPFVILYEDDAYAFWCFEMLLRRMWRPTSALGFEGRGEGEVVRLDGGILHGREVEEGREVAVAKGGTGVEEVQGFEDFGVDGVVEERGVGGHDRFDGRGEGVWARKVFNEGQSVKKKRS
ncbi:hypothetical protein Syun_004072 [Stephania yunnanensis]|uniref:Uncharacterized protein n=1 Tax=Stephania yunnanensis TaxID=152371 RepID=A0AAP0L4W9_9MAGN